MRRALRRHVSPPWISCNNAPNLFHGEKFRCRVMGPALEPSFLISSIPHLQCSPPRHSRQFNDSLRLHRRLMIRAFIIDGLPSASQGTSTAKTRVQQIRTHCFLPLPLVFVHTTRTPLHAEQHIHCPCHCHVRFCSVPRLDLHALHLTELPLLVRDFAQVAVHTQSATYPCIKREGVDWRSKSLESVDSQHMSQC